MSHFTVPRRVERVLASLGASEEFRQDVIGDLQEEFAIRAAWDGPAAARRWYYRESLRVAPHLLRDWWGRLGWRDVFRMFEVIVWCTIAVAALTTITRAFAVKLSELLGMSPQEILGYQPTRLAMMLAANALVSVATGYFAASMTPRARVPSALTTASFWAVSMSIGWFYSPQIVPTWFSAVNLITISVCMSVGGVFRATRDETSDTAAVAG